jgi:uncharacterized protein (TIGR00369 family)
MTDAVLASLQQVNAASPFDAWAGVELVSAGHGEAVLSLQARADLTQHAGFLHAGMQSALVDRACGFAAASVAGTVTTIQLQMSFYAPATGEQFVTRARVVRSGKRQVFATAELFSFQGNSEKLVASGSAVLAVLG